MYTYVCTYCIWNTIGYFIFACYHVILQLDLHFSIVIVLYCYCCSDIVIVNLSITNSALYSSRDNNFVDISIEAEIHKGCHVASREIELNVSGSL